MKKVGKRAVAKIKSDLLKDAAMKWVVAFLRTDIDGLRPGPAYFRRQAHSAAVEFFKKASKVISDAEIVKWMENFRYDAVLGDAGSHEMIMAIAADSIRSGGTVPKALRDYVAETMLWPPNLKRGRNTLRDITIVILVKWLCIIDGLSPTRNPYKKDIDKAVMSGCSIVSKALGKVGLHLSEDVVQKVWNSRKTAWRRRRKQSREIRQTNGLREADM
jgi:hypothetical protein